MKAENIKDKKIEDLLRKRESLLEEIDNEILKSYTKPITILFTDIVGSTKYFERSGDIAGRQMIQIHNDLLFPIIEYYNGKIIKTIGDSIMASFIDPHESVKCAIEMQEELMKYNRIKAASKKIKVRMGLHYGHAVMDDKDLFGDMVNTSSRVESKAIGEEIIISKALKEKIEKSSFPLVFLGSDYVKGKEKKIDFFLVNWNARDADSICKSWESRNRQAQGESKKVNKELYKEAYIEKNNIIIRKKIDLKKLAGEIKEKKAPVKKGNPFLNRVMIPNPEMFFGRKGIVKRIMSRISSESPQSISIVGERRIGKSSLLNFLTSPVTRLNYLDDTDDANNYLFVLIDFQQLRAINAEQIIEVIFKELKKQTGDSIEISVPANFDGMHFLCERITDEGLKIILLFDEFESITKNEKLGPDFYSYLRSLANNFQIAYITSSGKNLKDLCVSRAISDSPFFNIFAINYIGLFKENEAVSLITKLSKDYGRSLEPIADKIISIGGLYPFFLQMACSSWFEFLEDAELTAEDFINKETPSGVLGLFREEAETHFEYILETLPDAEKVIFRDMFKKISPNPLSSHVTSLERKGYLIRVDDKVRPFSLEFEYFLKKNRI